MKKFEARKFICKIQFYYYFHSVLLLFLFPKQIFHYISKLDLLELSGVDDHGKFKGNVDESVLDSCFYDVDFFGLLRNRLSSFSFTLHFK